MESQSTVQLVADKGIVGDASFGRKNRQILLVSSSVLSEYDLNPGDMRENVVIEGLAVDALVPDTRLTIGNAAVLITGPCAPCSRMDDVRDGLQRELQGKRGVLARALTDGHIAIGDPVSVE